MSASPETSPQQRTQGDEAKKKIDVVILSSKYYSTWTAIDDEAAQRHRETLMEVEEDNKALRERKQQRQRREERGAAAVPACGGEDADIEEGEEEEEEEEEEYIGQTPNSFLNYLDCFIEEYPCHYMTLVETQAIARRLREKHGLNAVVIGWDDPEYAPYDKRVEQEGGGEGGAATKFTNKNDKDNIPQETTTGLAHQFNWSQPKVVLVRTIWNYYKKFPAFLHWFSSAFPPATGAATAEEEDGGGGAQTRGPPASSENLVNCREMIMWNLDKHYLRDLEEQGGISIVPTVFVEEDELVKVNHEGQQKEEQEEEEDGLLRCRPLSTILAYDSPLVPKEWGSELVIKPCVGGGARETYRVVRHHPQAGDNPGASEGRLDFYSGGDEIDVGKVEAIYMDLNTTTTTTTTTTQEAVGGGLATRGTEGSNEGDDEVSRVRRRRSDNNLKEGEAFMVQPYLDTVVSHGEVSVIVINGKVSHAVLKKPKQGDFRVQLFFGAKETTFSGPEQLTPELREFAEACVRAATRCVPRAELPLYARVDVLPLSTRDGIPTSPTSGGVTTQQQQRWALMELELIEPQLWLDRHAGALDSLVDAVAERVLAHAEPDERH